MGLFVLFPGILFSAYYLKQLKLSVQNLGAIYLLFLVYLHVIMYFATAGTFLFSILLLIYRREDNIFNCINIFIGIFYIFFLLQKSIKIPNNWSTLSLKLNQNFYISSIVKVLLKKNVNIHCEIFK